jgi:hypothetical protein
MMLKLGIKDPSGTLLMNRIKQIEWGDRKGRTLTKSSGIYNGEIKSRMEWRIGSTNNAGQHVYCELNRANRPGYITLILCGGSSHEHIKLIGSP